MAEANVETVTLLQSLTQHFKSFQNEVEILEKKEACGSTSYSSTPKAG